MSPRPSVPAALLAAMTALCLLAAGCSSADPSTAAASVADVSVTSAGARKAPTIAVPQDFSVPSTSTRVIREGQGATVAEGDVIGMQYVMINGRTGEQVAASGWDQLPTSLVVDGSILPGLRTGLVGRRVNSQVLIAIAPEDGLRGATSPEQAKVAPGDSLLFLVDIVSAVPPRAVGTPVPPEKGLPVVTLDEGTGEPSIELPDDQAPPEDLVVQQLIKGTGPDVEAGQTVRVQYTGVRWSDHQVFDSSWDAQGGDGAPGSPVPFVIGEGQVIPGWDVALTDQPVGSQVLVIVPPADGYGEAGNTDAGISGTETLVFVVDVLAAS